MDNVKDIVKQAIKEHEEEFDVNEFLCVFVTFLFLVFIAPSLFS